uniref:Uncharacterized protein n=1 Tax=Arundo donax TaxID=35708 RepID=A0A0A8ZHI7_ARUDO
MFDPYLQINCHSCLSHYATIRSFHG